MVRFWARFFIFRLSLLYFTYNKESMEMCIFDFMLNIDAIHFTNYTHLHPCSNYTMPMQ